MSLENPLISVLIPAYNHENYIQETVKSIINQTYQNIELIVIDDGSSDSTWQKLQAMKEECENRFSNVIFETKENEGTCKTLNKLLSLANGEFVYIIASDDLAKPQAIEIEESFLSNNSDYALCVGDNEIIDSDSKRCYWDKERNNIYDKHKAEYKTFVEFLESTKSFKFTSDKFGTYETIYLGNYIPNGYLIRKEVFNNFRFTSEAPLEDFNLMLHISKYYKMKYIDDVLFSYRWHIANTIKNMEKMSDYHKKTLIYEDKILKEVDKDKMFPRLLEYINNGFLYKSFKIPFIFEIKKYRNSSIKTTVVKLFNIQIYRKQKKVHYN